jgi:excisionase family DNA binding protein
MGAKRPAGPTDPFSSPLMTRNDVANFLQVSVRTVQRLIDDKKLSVVRIGRSVRIHPDALKTLIGG